MGILSGLSMHRTREGGWCADEARTAQSCPPGLGPLSMGELPLPKGARVLLSELGF